MKTKLSIFKIIIIILTGFLISSFTPKIKAGETLFSYEKTPKTKPIVGMYYYLIPESETKCSKDFPEGLSFFFEQVGGYDEYSAVNQLEKELNIDLSIFQNTFVDDIEIFKSMEEFGEIDDYKVEFKKHERKTRIKVEFVITLLLKFKNKIETNKNFASKIKFNNNKDLPKSVRELCPPEIKYYKSGEFLNDINTLIFTLKCFNDDEIKYFRFGYS